MSPIVALAFLPAALQRIVALAFLPAALQRIVALAFLPAALGRVVENHALNNSSAPPASAKNGRATTTHPSLTAQKPWFREPPPFQFRFQAAVAASFSERAGGERQDKPQPPCRQRHDSLEHPRPHAPAPPHNQALATAPSDDTFLL